MYKILWYYDISIQINISMLEEAIRIWILFRDHSNDTPLLSAVKSGQEKCVKVSLVLIGFFYTVCLLL